MKGKIVVTAAHGYDAAGNPIKTKDWSQNFVTTRKITFQYAEDLDGEVFDLDEIEDSGLYDYDKDIVVIPKGTELHFNGYRSVGGHKFASYVLPQYNNAEFVINFDFWNLDLSKKVKAVEADTSIQGSTYGPSLLQELIDYYSAQAFMTTEDIWEDVWAEYKDENLANEVVEGLYDTSN